MAQECNIEIKVKATWVKPVAIFICRYLKKRWMLKALHNITVAKIYVNGELKSKVKFSEIL